MKVSITMPEIPKGAKKPQDRAAKAEAKGDDLVITYNGAEYVIERAVVDDVEFFELVADMDAKPYILTKIVQMLLGAKQYEAFKNANRDDAGRVSIDHLAAFFNAADNVAGNS